MEKFNALRIMFRDYEELLVCARTCLDERLSRELKERICHQQHEITNLIGAIKLDS